MCAEETHWPFSQTAHIPLMKKEMRAFPSSTSAVYHSTFEYLSSNQDPDALQDRKVGSLFLLQIPIRIVLTSRSVAERTSMLFCSHLVSLSLTSDCARAWGEVQT